MALGCMAVVTGIVFLVDFLVKNGEGNDLANVMVVRLFGATDTKQDVNMNNGTSITFANIAD